MKIINKLIKGNDEKGIHFLFAATITVALFFSFLFYFPNIAKADSFSCSGVLTQNQAFEAKHMGLITDVLSVQGGFASATVVNKTNCSLPITLESWKMYDTSLASQKYFANSSVTISANSTQTLSVSLPSCMSQIDLYYGSVLNTPVGDSDLCISSIFNQNDSSSYRDASGNFCKDTQPILVTCSANPSSIQTGQSATFTSNVSGGTGSYIYSWSGACTGTSSNCSNTFSQQGTQTSALTITSGSQTATANCSVAVTQNTPGLSVTCSANPSSIQTGQSATFTSNVSGGTGSYIYSWSGACTGTSSNCSNTFSQQGTQTSALTITSGSQTATANCSVAVTQNTPGLSVTCSANPSSIQTGQSATFTSNVSGGTGSYIYSWSGACTGTSSNCSNTFSNVGTQTSAVTITSGSQSSSASCSVVVNQTNTCTLNYQQRCTGNSMYWYDSCGNQGSYVGSCGNTCTLNYQQRCTGNSMYWYDSCGNQGSYVGSCGQTYTSSTLTASKQVRDITTGSGFSNSTYANPSDMLMFMITLQASGNQDVQNVLVRDSLPSNLIYSNQLVVACTGSNNYNGYNSNSNSNCNNNNYNYSGNITSGVNLNTIYAGQTVTITYQTQVASAQNFSYGTTTLNNSVSATSSNSGYTPVSNASVIVTRSTVLGASTVSTGLTNNFWVDSFFLPLLITLIGIWMWRSGIFFGIEKWLDSKKRIRRGYKAEKELASRISTIRKSGK